MVNKRHSCTLRFGLQVLFGILLAGFCLNLLLIISNFKPTLGLQTLGKYIAVSYYTYLCADTQTLIDSERAIPFGAVPRRPITTPGPMARSASVRVAAAPELTPRPVRHTAQGNR